MFTFLDEPSNDLDVETLRALEEALLNFPGQPLWCRMIDGSWTASVLILWRLKVILRWYLLKATTEIMKKIEKNVWVIMPIVPRELSIVAYISRDKAFLNMLNHVEDY